MIPRQPQPASQEQLNTWWGQFKETGDRPARDRLAEHYWPAVQKTARRLKVRLADQVNLDDLISAGSIGLLEALDGFDPSRRVKFETFSAQRIRGAMLDELRSTDWVPRLVRKRARQVRQAADLFQASAGRRPDEKELARQLKLSVRRCRRVVRDARVATVVPLGLSTRSQEDDGEMALPADPTAETPDCVAQRHEIEDILARHLDRIQRLILVMYYYEKMSQGEIGATLRISESRVCQILAATLALVRSRLENRRAVLLSA